jgi:hypothetical protein
MRIAWPVVAMACWSACWASSPPTAVAPSAPGALVITATGVGPIDARTVATLANLRAILPHYKIVPLNDPQLEYEIYDGREKLGFVVINDDATVFNVHATSAKVAVADRAWRAGQPFGDARTLTRCECWGSNPTCYKTGEHVAVNFDRSCLESEDARAFKVLDGAIVQRVIWSVTPFGAEPDPHGGVDDGTPATDGADPDAP